MKHSSILRRGMVLGILLFLQLSCTLWNERDWEKLQDRQFYFSRFSYFLKGHDKATALRFMREFPVKEMMALVSVKYRIQVDMTHFRDFVDKGDASQLKAFGVIMDETFLWQNDENKKNIVEFEYVNRFIDESGELERSYTLTIKTGRWTRALFSGKVENRDGVLKSLAAQLSKS